MAVLSVTYTLANGQTPDASLWNTNYADIVNWLNNFYNGTSTWPIVKGTQIYFGVGSAASPGISMVGDTTTGLHQVSAGVLGVSYSGVKGADFFSTGSSNGTTYTPLRLFGGGKTKVFQTETETGVQTSADTILTGTTDGNFVIVYGKQTVGGTAEFCDLVLYGAGATTLVKALTVSGSPDTRTYTATGLALKVAMGANTYTVTSFSMGTNG